MRCNVVQHCTVANTAFKVSVRTFAFVFLFCMMNNHELRRKQSSLKNNSKNMDSDDSDDSAAFKGTERREPSEPSSDGSASAPLHQRWQVVVDLRQVQDQEQAQEQDQE